MFTLHSTKSHSREMVTNGLTLLLAGILPLAFFLWPGLSFTGELIRDSSMWWLWGVAAAGLAGIGALSFTMIRKGMSGGFSLGIEGAELWIKQFKVRRFHREDIRWFELMTIEGLQVIQMQMTEGGKTQSISCTYPVAPSELLRLLQAWHRGEPVRLSVTRV